MKNRLVVTAALAAAICTTAAWSQGGPRPGGPGGPGGPMMAPCPVGAVMPIPAGAVDQLTQALQLTTDQAASLKQVLTTGETTMQTLRQKSGDASKALHDALFAATYDADAVKALAATAQAAEADVIGASIDEWTQIRSILTADQVTVLQKMMSPDRQRPAGPPPSDSSSQSRGPKRR